ncbi:nucleolar pre-ribosomal-associated protein 1 [Panulirus ornatus]|uniref:nucleolar pre-ribosomal-associated protein 1 n=1 Tax=Panulirus ornatus TaxID=150431 RepID=UPI003A85A3C2
MKITHLIKELSGNLPIAALDEFNTYMEENTDVQRVIHGFLLASRNCDEILDVLSVEKRTVSELATIFTALSHILLSIAGDLSEFRHVGLHITQEILHKHYSLVYKLLTPHNNNRSIKAVLSCLTGMVMVGGDAANELLMTIEWEEINFSHILHRRNLKEVRDVRTNCVYLFLAFLNSEDSHVMKQFLQKKDVFPAIFPGLMWDPCERVINVLKVMHKSVLLNPDVSKTMKVNLFTPSTTKPLLELYNWLGPIGRLAKDKEMQGMENQDLEDIRKDRVRIREVLHSFMLTLCSSTKNGIIFKEKIQEGQIKSNNWYVYKIVSNMKSPWESFEGRELMSHVLRACPDLLKPYLFSLKDFLSPRPTKAFISLVDLLIEIIAHQTPWKRAEANGYVGVITCLLPRPLNQQFFLSLLQSEHGTVQHSGLRLILAILSKTKETVENIMGNEAFSQKIKRLTCRKLTNKVLENIGIGDSIMHCWNVAAGEETPDGKSDGECIALTETAHSVPKVFALLIIAKVLTFYIELVPHQPILEVMNPVEMLQVVKELPAEDDSVKNSKAKLELQVLCLGFLSKRKHSQEIVLDSALVMKDLNQQIEKNIVYQLICTYAQAKNESVMHKDYSLMLSVTDKCQNILSNSLAKLGLSSHYDGNIKFWLKHISSNDAVKQSKQSVFVTQVIQKTVSSLSHYTDLLIEIGTKYHLHTGIHGQIYSCMSELESMKIVDNEDVSAVSFSLPFSRLVLAAIDLLGTEPDSEYIQYFSNVINDYLHSLNDTEFIAKILLQNESILTSDLRGYLKCLFCESYPHIEKAPVLAENARLSEILRYLFMTHDWLSVETLLEGKRLKEAIEKKNLESVVLQLLLYVHLESGSKKKRCKHVKRFTKILKNIYTVLEEDDDDKSCEQVTQIVLEHPRTLGNYQPFSLKKSAFTRIAQEFLEFGLEKHPSLAPKTCPYFEKLVKEIETAIKKDSSVDFWNPVAPFISSQNTLVSYEEIEKLLIICFKGACLSLYSQSILVLQLIKLLLKTTSAKRKPGAQTVQLMLTKFLEWCRTEDGSEMLEDIMKTLEKLLIQVTSTEVAEQLTKDDLKCLLQSHPPSADLCCHLVRVHPPHGLVLVKHLKKHGTVLPAHASLLGMLIDQDATMSAAEAALVKVTDNIKNWALDMDDEDDATSVLLTFALKKDLLGSCLRIGRELHAIVPLGTKGVVGPKEARASRLCDGGAPTAPRVPAHRDSVYAGRGPKRVPPRRARVATGPPYSSNCIYSPPLRARATTRRGEWGPLPTLSLYPGTGPGTRGLTNPVPHHNNWPSKSMSSVFLHIPLSFIPAHQTHSLSEPPALRQNIHLRVWGKPHYSVKRINPLVAVRDYGSSTANNTRFKASQSSVFAPSPTLTSHFDCPWFPKLPWPGFHFPVFLKTTVHFLHVFAPVINLHRPNFVLDPSKNPLISFQTYPQLSSLSLFVYFSSQVLRFGLNDQWLGPDLVHTLGLLCAVMYRNNDQRKDKGDSLLPINTVYQMIITHSQYLSLMSSRAEKEEKLKEEVITLQQILVDCEPKVCQESHVPILLRAYGASMSTLDQRILKLLHTYEMKGFMSNYQPVLWGDAAVAHFGVESSDFSLLINPKPEQILGLLEMDKIIQTCYKFDTRLHLEPTEIQKEDRSIYDVRFLIPLMLYLAEEKRMSEIEYAECGAVAIGFIAMTSHHQEVWGAGAAILRCMVERMEKSRLHRLKLPWLWLVGVVSCAFEGEQRPLPALSTHFVIHASRLLSHPEHPMYRPVLNYLFIRPVFKLYKVPELYELYSSTHVTDHWKHRSFLLTILATGIRQVQDYKICQRTFTSTLMIGMLQAPTTDNELRVQVLEVLEAMVRITHGAVDLVRNQNLLTVLPLVILPVNTTVPAVTTKTVNPIVIAAVVKVLSALWASLYASITRVDYTIAYSGEEEGSVAVNSEEMKESKRKRHDENYSESRKKVRIDSSYADFDIPDSNIDEFDSKIKDVDLNESNSDKNCPKEKILPTIFVHEFLNCLTLLIPTIIACAPPAITAQHLMLVSETVKYLDTLAESSVKKSNLCSVALAPGVIKQQVYDCISWDLLYERLQDHLSDADEVKLLGSKVKDRWDEWQREPLCRYLKKQAENRPADAAKGQEHQNLRDAVIKLLNELGK